MSFYDDFYERSTFAFESGLHSGELTLKSMTEAIEKLAKSEAMEQLGKVELDRTRLLNSYLDRVYGDSIGGKFPVYREDYYKPKKENAMCEIKVGDQVKVLTGIYRGELAIITEDDTAADSDEYWDFEVRFDSGSTEWYDDDQLELVKKAIKTNKGGPMSTVSRIAKKLLDKETKALVKANYLDSDLNLTQDGEAALMSILFEANKTELASLAEAETKEAKEDSKK